MLQIYLKFVDARYIFTTIINIHLFLGLGMKGIRVNSIK